MPDGGWLALAFTVGSIVGAAVLGAVARHRGHVRVTLEVGDPPERSPDRGV